MNKLKILEACFYVSFQREIRLRLTIKVDKKKHIGIIFNNSNSIKIFNDFNVSHAHELIGKKPSIDFLQSLLRNNKDCSPPLSINE